MKPVSEMSQEEIQAEIWRILWFAFDEWHRVERFYRGLAGWDKQRVVLGYAIDYLKELQAKKDL